MTSASAFCPSVESCGHCAWRKPKLLVSFEAITTPLGRRGVEEQQRACRVGLARCGVRPSVFPQLLRGWQIHFEAKLGDWEREEGAKSPSLYLPLPFLGPLLQRWASRSGGFVRCILRAPS